MMNVTILGAGAYSIALSRMFKKNNCNITMWTKIQSEYDYLVKNRSNDKVLPGYKIDEGIKFSINMKESIKNADIIVIAVPVKFVRDVIIDLSEFYNRKQHICIASKGIEQDSLLFVSSIIHKYIRTKRIAVISGGTFAVDIIKDVPTALTIASKNEFSIKAITKALQNDSFMLETSKDILGVEMYGAIKNVIAIASGMVDGMGYPESTKCMFMTKALNDVMNIIYYLGGNKKTILTYAGIGDLSLTCTSAKSRNYSLGLMFGKKLSKKEIQEYINNTTIEGLYTLKSIYNLIHSKKKKMLIIDIIYDIIYRDGDISKLEKYLRS